MWVSPFGHLRIKACLQLPAAYRSLPRPSSAPIAKAFPLRPLQLDQAVTPLSRRLRELCHRLDYFVVPTSSTVKPLFYSFPLVAFHLSSYCSVFKVQLVGPSGLEPPTSRLSGVRSNHLSYEPTSGGDEEVRTPDPLRARQVLSHLSYTPITCRRSGTLPRLPRRLTPSKLNNVSDLLKGSLH